ncbi:hypothetical protein H0H81_007044 [Sphagnurus paluster]|uniref:Uncharacterized protein n=1 Tax=Sphagnurus paluster TaxID=117069 RepID=A0A9P7GJP3_9AGAR|nr:hypothetical protein H0H81_007044 [Sphagnurus paluster]
MGKCSSAIFAYGFILKESDIEKLLDALDIDLRGNKSDNGLQNGSGDGSDDDSDNGSDKGFEKALEKASEDGKGKGSDSKGSDDASDDEIDDHEPFDRTGSDCAEGNSSEGLDKGQAKLAVRFTGKRGTFLGHEYNADLWGYDNR